MTWTQIRELGVAKSTIARWLEQGYLHRVLPGVYAIGHCAPSYEADLTAALLHAGPGAMLSHGTAAHWLDLLDDRPSQIHVSTPRQRRSRPGIIVHPRRPLDRIWHTGFPTTSVAQTLVDLAATYPLRLVRRALAKADYNRTLDVEAVAAALRFGRPGSVRLRAALESHRPELARAKSALEALLVEICEQAGVDPPELNALIAGWEVDAVWRRQRVAVELDGYHNHRSPAQNKRDRRKEMALRAAGYASVRYSHEQLTRHRAEVIADLRRMGVG